MGQFSEFQRNQDCTILLLKQPCSSHVFEGLRANPKDHKLMHYALYITTQRVYALKQVCPSRYLSLKGAFFSVSFRFFDIVRVSCVSCMTRNYRVLLLFVRSIGNKHSYWQVAFPSRLCFPSRQLPPFLCLVWAWLLERLSCHIFLFYILQRFHEDISEATCSILAGSGEKGSLVLIRAS